MTIVLSDRYWESAVDERSIDDLISDPKGFRRVSILSISFPKERLFCKHEESLTFCHSMHTASCRVSIKDRP